MKNANNVIEMKGKSPMQVVTITPEIAREWLNSNVHNRPVRETTIRRLVTGDATTISPRLRDQINDLYDAWWDKRAPERTRFEHGAATAARRRAIAGNWCAGAGLDDDELDTPGYRPASKWKPATGTGIAPDITPPAQRPRKDNRP